MSDITKIGLFLGFILFTGICFYEVNFDGEIINQAIESLEKPLELKNWHFAFIALLIYRIKD